MKCVKNDVSVDVMWLNFCAEAECRPQNLGAVPVVEEDGMVALTINVLLARARQGNQTEEMPLAVMLEKPESHGQNMTQGTMGWSCG